MTGSRRVSLSPAMLLLPRDSLGSKNLFDKSPFGLDMAHWEWYLLHMATNTTYTVDFEIDGAYGQCAECGSWNVRMDYIFHGRDWENGWYVPTEDISIAPDGSLVCEDCA